MLDCDASSAVNECPSDRIRPGGARMAPAPDQDTAPKAPDKSKHDKAAAAREKSKDDKILSDLNDGELKGLLDEALNYKNPKDREGKSKLFNHLLSEAEEDERNARAARAGGSELVRYCNPSAKRNSRHRKKPSSISENMMHGGSLDNLAKEELFETSKHRTKKSVSARQREGGSLPCNVNASTVTNLEYQFLEEARRKKEMSDEKQSFITSTDLESERLLEHDCLAKNYQEQATPVEIVQYPLAQQKFTSRATFQVNNVDDPIQVSHLDQPSDRKTILETKLFSQKGSIFLPNNITSRILDDGGKKVDENGNALQQNTIKTKKKKVLTDKNVVVCNAENVEGHRSDIINDMDKLMEFIGITPEQEKTNRSIKKQLNRHSSDDNSSKSKKQRAHSSKSKDNRAKLQKSNSLGEISTTNLDDFEFDKDKVVLRNNKNSTEKPRERRSWGNMEPMPLQNLYSNASAENLESAEFRVVTKKKKSKKRRNSISGRTKASSTPTNKSGGARGPSPDPRRKSACSVPHSEKSNDSSDVDSVHSLPIDTQRLDMAAARLNMPISYADMARNTDQKQTKKVPKDAETAKLINNSNNNSNNTDSNSCSSASANSSPNASVIVNNNVAANNNVKSNHNNNISNSSNNVNVTPPDVHNIKSFPAITKQVAVQVNVVNDNNSSKAMIVNKTSNICNNVKIGKGVNATVNRSVQVRNHLAKAVVCVVGSHHNSMQNEFMIMGSAEDMETQYSKALPPDIPDVQTIEKLQRINCLETTTTTAASNCCSNSAVDCDMSERTSVDNRPPVVILSGLGNSKEVPGLVFGFDINEQLLSEDAPVSQQTDSCEDFVARYVPPEIYNTTTSHNHEMIVNYIGAAWEEALVNVSTGKVQYYTDLL